MRFRQQQASGSISFLFALSSFERKREPQKGTKSTKESKSILFCALCAFLWLNSRSVSIHFHHDPGCPRPVFRTLKAQPKVTRRDGEPEVGLRNQRPKHIQEADMRHHLYLISLEFAGRGSYPLR